MPNSRIHRIFADNTNERSVATDLRRRRFRLFTDMLAHIEPPVRILDVGGRQKYWEMMGFLPDAGHSITLLNIVSEPITLPHFTSVQGDARHMSMFGPAEFDIVFSNSVIEHVGSFEDQRRMANEVRRVGKRYYVQTPNRFFPIEPHFVFPCFQFLPLSWRVWLVQHFSLGWYPRLPDREHARREVASIRLLSAAELVALFPDGALYRERYLGLTKSFVIYKRG